ncbi:MAG: hypothetical protein HY904_13610 [Deltaproteobacteria bacterium]|nr:hypothetical protein [Deltaproteobacteria bacterium]
MSVNRPGGAPRPQQPAQTGSTQQTQQTQQTPQTTETAPTQGTAPTHTPRTDQYARGGAAVAAGATASGEVRSAETRHASGPFGLLRGAADRLGGALDRAGTALQDGGRVLQQAGVPGGSALVDVGREAQSAGHAVSGAPDAAVRTAGELHTRANDLANRGEQLLEGAREGVREATRPVMDALQQVGRGVDTLRQAADQFGRTVGDAVDLRRNIDALGPGDKYTVGLGGNASVEGGKVYARGSIEVERRSDGRYTVSAGGELGGGVYAELGGRAGMRASGTAEATLGAGGRVEMTFDNAADAERASRILARQAASSAVGAAGAASGIPGSTLAGTAASQALAPPPADMQWLARHTSAVELRGNVAGEIAGGLGLADQNTRLLGAFGRGAVRAEEAVRIEFTGGRPSSLVTRSQFTADLQGGAGVGLQTGRANDGAATGIGVGGGVQAQATMERRYTIPAGINGDDVMRDPRVLLRAGDAMQRTREDRLTLTLDAQGQAVGNAAGTRAQVVMTGNTDRIAEAAIRRLAQRDLPGAMRAAGDGVRVEANATPYTQTGISVSPSISVMGFGVGIEAQAIRQDVADRPTWQASGTATQAADEFARFVREHPELLYAATAAR